VFFSTSSSVAHTECHIHVLVQQGKCELQSSRLEPHQHSLGCIRLHASSFYSRHENAPVYHTERHLGWRVEVLSVLELWIEQI
jgi:hypothetical protein